MDKQGPEKSAQELCPGIVTAGGNYLGEQLATYTAEIRKALWNYRVCR